jgi:hypothetical protein
MSTGLYEEERDGSTDKKSGACTPLFFIDDDRLQKSLEDLVRLC